jgi:hypothetical protein
MKREREMGEGERRTGEEVAGGEREDDYVEV